jgi:hypothetical protein
MGLTNQAFHCHRLVAQHNLFHPIEQADPSPRLRGFLSDSHQGFNIGSTGAAGLEPATGGLEVRYSIQLSYAPQYSYSIVYHHS